MNPKTREQGQKLTPISNAKGNDLFYDGKYGETSNKKDPSYLFSILEDFVVKYKQDWKMIAFRLSNFLGRKHSVSTLKRIYKQMNGNKKRGRFTRDIDKKIMQLIKQYGRDWKRIADCFPNLKPLSIRNRFYSIFLKNKTFRNQLLAIEASNNISNAKPPFNTSFSVS